MKITSLLYNLRYTVFGIGVLLCVWYLYGIWAVRSGEFLYVQFSIGATFDAMLYLVDSGRMWESVSASMVRIFKGLAYATVIGVFFGLVTGVYANVRQTLRVPIQFFRMISPLSLMPIAVMAIDGWDEAIVFLLAFASVWPILLSTANGVARIDEGWLKVANNYQANVLQKLQFVILPAVAPDILAGVRLSLGVSWVVLVPAEFLGVTSGLGYAINDARDTLEYSWMMALVVMIGFLGFVLDTILESILKQVNWKR